MAILATMGTISLWDSIDDNRVQLFFTLTTLLVQQTPELSDDLTVGVALGAVDLAALAHVTGQRKAYPQLCNVPVPNGRV